MGEGIWKTAHCSLRLYLKYMAVMVRGSATS